MKRWAVLILAVVLQSNAGTQTPPNYSGHWSASSGATLEIRHTPTELSLRALHPLSSRVPGGSGALLKGAADKAEVFRLDQPRHVYIDNYGSYSERVETKAAWTGEALTLEIDAFSSWTEVSSPEDIDRADRLLTTRVLKLGPDSRTLRIETECCLRTRAQHAVQRYSETFNRID